VLALDIADVLQALVKSAQTVDSTVGRRGMEESDHRYRLLRTRRERPCRRAAQKCDEVTPSHADLPVQQSLPKSGVVRHSKIARSTTAMGQSRPFGPAC